jgi:hypothetical protein
MRFLTVLWVQRVAHGERRAKEDKMSEERPQHPQEPAEGSDEDVEAAGAERAGKPTKIRRGLALLNTLRNQPKAARKMWTQLVANGQGAAVSRSCLPWAAVPL